MTALLLSCLPMQGQVRFGIKAGMALDTQEELGLLWDKSQITSGFTVGGFIEYPFNEKLSLQTELNFQQKGEEHNSDDNNSAIRNEFNYLSVPLLVKGTFNDELGLKDGWNIFGYTGPYYSYLTSAKFKVKEGSTTTNQDITGNSERNDWGMVFGGGVSYQIKNAGKVFCDLRYDMGLHSIDNDNPDLRNKVLGLSLGYCF